MRWLVGLSTLLVMVTGGAAISAGEPMPISGGAAGPVFSAGSAAARATSPRTLTVPVPSGARQGDVLLASIASDGASTVTPPNGWSEVPGARAEVAATGVRAETFETVAGAAPPAAYTFASSGGASLNWDGVITAFAGVDGGGPVEAAAAQVNGASSTTVTAPSITPTVGGSTLVFVAVGGPTAGLSAPPGMTEQATVSGSGQPAIGETVASETDPAPGATGAVSAAGDGAAAASAGILIALSPTPPPAPTPPPTSTPTTTPTPAPPQTTTSPQSPAVLSTTGATSVSSGNASLGASALARCSNGCRVWMRWRPASSTGAWTTGASTDHSGQNVFEAYNLAAGTTYEYEVCDSLSQTQCYNAKGVADASASGAATQVSTFTTRSCAGAQGHYGQSLPTAALNFGAMPSYTCPPFADGAETAWGTRSPMAGGTPDPPVLADSATMVSDILTNGFDDISVGKDNTGWPLYYGSAGDPVYTIDCSGTCPAVRTVHVPAGAQAENDVDHHVSVIDQSTNPPVEYDMWGVSSISPAPCHPCVIHAINAGRAPVNGNGQETGSNGDGADAAHDALQAGVLRAEELFGAGFDGGAPAGVSVRHAIAISVPCTADHIDGNEVYPAAGNDGSVCPAGESDAPEMGQRFVLRAPVAQIDAAPEPQWKKNLLLGLDYYGAIVVDTNGASNATSIRYQGEASYQLPNAANPVWSDPWMSFAAANDDGVNIIGYTSVNGGPKTAYALVLDHDAWFEKELRTYLVAVKPCVSLGNCP